MNGRMPIEERARAMVEASPDDEPARRVVRRLFDTQVTSLREDPDLIRAALQGVINSGVTVVQAAGNQSSPYVIPGTSPG